MAHCLFGYQHPVTPMQQQTCQMKSSKRVKLHRNWCKSPCLIIMGNKNCSTFMHFLWWIQECLQRMITLVLLLLRLELFYFSKAWMLSIAYDVMIVFSMMHKCICWALGGLWSSHGLQVYCWLCSHIPCPSVTGCSACGHCPQCQWALCSCPDASTVGQDRVLSRGDVCWQLWLE